MNDTNQTAGRQGGSSAQDARIDQCEARINEVEREIKLTKKTSWLGMLNLVVSILVGLGALYGFLQLQGVVHDTKRDIEIKEALEQVWEELGGDLGAPHVRHERETDRARLGRAEAKIRTVLMLDEENPTALRYMGILKIREQQLDEAIEFLKFSVSAARLRSDNRALARALCCLGSALDAMGDTEEALRTYREAIETQPGYCLPMFNMGNTLRHLNRPDEAREAFLSASACPDVRAEALTNLGDLYCDLSLWNEALEAYEGAIEADPSLPGPHRGIERVLAENGEAD